jgi:integrase
MPRAVKDAKLDTRTARANLKPSGKPYYRALDHGLHLGYRKGARSGRWVARIYLGDQKYEVETIATADDRAEADGIDVLDWSQAQAKARERKARLVKAAAGIDDEPLTVRQACEDYATNLRAEKGERAAKDAEGRLNKRLVPVLGKTLLADMTTQQFRDWRNGLVRDEEDHDEEQVRRSRDTTNRVLGIAKAAFNHAFYNGRVADDRAWRKVKGFKGVGEARKVILTDAELQKLIDACGTGLRELVLIGAWTGARLGELTSVRVRDLDRDQATLHVSGKTGARDVHLAADGLALLKRLASGKRPDDLLLTTAAGGTWTKSLHQRPFAEAVAKAGMDPETTFYALRHSYISRALKALVPVKAVADQCGTSMAMIERYYAKWIPADQAEYAKAAAPTLQIKPTEKVARLGAVA